MTSKEEIREWLLKGKELGASHVLIIMDGWDLMNVEDYPLYILPGDNLKEILNRYPVERGSIERLLECYDLRKDVEEQLSEVRSMNIDT